MFHSARPLTLIFGGTFDPPHRGHVALPPLVAEHLGAALVLYIPAGANPLKDDPPTPAVHRVAMLELALADVAGVAISTIEVDRQGPSYTVDTLEALHAERPRERFRLLMGADAALSFPRWRDPERIIELAEPAVMLRPPWEEELFLARLEATLSPEDAARWAERIVAVPTMDVSATEVRRRLHEGGSLAGLVPRAVLDYIEREGLYR